MEHKFQTVLVIAAFIGALTFNARAQHAELRLEKPAIALGEQVSLFVEFTLPGGWPEGDMPADFWPIQGDTLSAQIEIIDRSPFEEDVVNGDLIVHQELIVTSFDTGFVVIQPVRFQFAGASIESNALLLQVTLPALDESGPRTNKASREVKYTWFDQFIEHIWWVLAGLALVIALLLWIRYSKRKTLDEPAEQTPKAPRKPAHIEALEALAVLREKQLWQKGHVKAYYTDLTDILRRYIERRYAVNTLERTSREIIADLKLCGVPADTFARLKATLELADMVKFAKYTALPNENEQALSNAELFVKTTMNETESHE